MKTIIQVIVSVYICIFSQICTAQIDDDKFRWPQNMSNIQDQELFKQRAKECVRMMNTYITSMTKEQSLKKGLMRPTTQDRWDSRAAALTLFLENGEPIRIVSEDGRETYVAPVLMEVSNANTHTTKTDPVKDYFQHLIELITKKPPRYTSVTIASSAIESMDVTSIKPVGNRYQCVVSYTQEFIGKRGEVAVYSDITKKQIVVWFVPQINPYGDKVPVPRLGDISCQETQKK